MQEPREGADSSFVAEQRVVSRSLERAFEACRLLRPFRRAAYDAGDRLEYEMTGVAPANRARVVARVERFVGGGYAGQVYRVRLEAIEALDGPIAGLETGTVYALKILRPPGAFALWFRNLLYRIGYQAHFGAQVQPSAVRVGVLWQTLIRRAMALETGDERAVCASYATFYDPELQSHGEISEWIDGRIWKFETDDRLFDRWRFTGAVPADHNAPEYVHKKLFMRRLVRLLRRMGAGELARQYEWWTMKSAPNVLKRRDAEGSPTAGLTAVDFRAGLTLLPFLPMSPADVGLILRGLARGRLVQFDRCDLRRLRRYVETRDGFDDLAPVLDELERQTRAYRRSQPDLTHQGLRLFVDRGLRASVKAGAITSWRHRGLLDGAHEARLTAGRWPFALLYVFAAVPLVGPRVLGLWGRDWSRRHLARCLRSRRYLGRALRGARIEVLVRWERAGRVSAASAVRLVDRPLGFWTQRLLVGWLPPSWHRFLTDWRWARRLVRERIDFSLRFLRQPEFREEFLLGEVAAGRDEGMLTDEEADRIVRQVKDPFIQKYLRCLAVHVCTVPVTQVVMLVAGVAVGAYCLLYRQLSWPESVALGTAAAAAIQLLPVSPGSMARGVFVLYLMVRERDVKNYYIAAPVSFLHVIGYLAFPLQMVTQNPALARFLAGRWTKNTVHIVPVFGESGALLEHAIFDLVFNLPISLVRRFRARPVRWSLGSAAVVSSLLLGAFVAYGYLWEWWQEPLELEGVAVLSVEPYSAADWLPYGTLAGQRLTLDGVDGVVDLPVRRWDGELEPGDMVDVLIRKSFRGPAYDGLILELRSSPGLPAPGPTGEHGGRR